MDFTHETGFTKETLAQVMRNVFADVRVVRSTPVIERGWKSKIGARLRPALISFINIFLKIIGEGASDVWWHSRGIIGTGRRTPSHNI
jgi:hypothetical protein